MHLGRSLRKTEFQVRLGYRGNSRSDQVTELKKQNKTKQKRCVRKQNKVSKMAQWVKALGKTNDVILTPGIHVKVDREN